MTQETEHGDEVARQAVPAASQDLDPQQALDAALAAPLEDEKKKNKKKKKKMKVDEVMELHLVMQESSI